MTGAQEHVGDLSRLLGDEGAGAWGGHAERAQEGILDADVGGIGEADAAEQAAELEERAGGEDEVHGAASGGAAPRVLSEDAGIDQLGGGFAEDLADPGGFLPIEGEHAGGAELVLGEDPREADVARGVGGAQLVEAAGSDALEVGVALDVDPSGPSADRLAD